MNIFKLRPIIVWLTMSVSVFFLVMPPSNLYAKSCADKCSDAGFNSSSSQGTAPFCNGWCGDIWQDVYGFYSDYDNNPVTDIGESSDESSCLSGSKRCCCRKILDCKSGCQSAGYGSNIFSCVKEDAITNPSGLIGWCDSDFICQCGSALEDEDPDITPILN